MKRLDGLNNKTQDNIFSINSFTTENIAGYLKYFNLYNKKVLTIDNSSDQLLNCVFFCANNLSLCNSNIISKYYLYLKIAGLLSLNYNEFQWFFLKHNNHMHNNNRMFSKKLFKRIGPTLKIISEESYFFFAELFDSIDSKKVRSEYFFDSNYHNKALKNFNIYLRNENTFNKLGNTIEHVNIDYINKNIVSDNIDGKFDIILLSSLCIKLTLNKFINLIKKLDSNNLNNSGDIVLAYLWNNNIYTEEYSDVWKKIYNNPESNKYLKKYISDYYQVSGYQNYLWEDNKRNDKVLVYRK